MPSPATSEAPPKTTFALQEVVVKGLVPDRIRRDAHTRVRDAAITHGASPAEVTLTAIQMQLDELEGRLDTDVKDATVKIRGFVAGRPITVERPLTPSQIKR